jgi:hypothetical protein
VSYGRKRRSADDLQVIKGNVTELYKYSGNSTSDELPLQASIIVQDTRSNGQNIFPNPLRAKDNPCTFIILGSGKFRLFVRFSFLYNVEALRITKFAEFLFRRR